MGPKVPAPLRIAVKLLRALFILELGVGHCASACPSIKHSLRAIPDGAISQGGCGFGSLLGTGNAFFKWPETPKVVSGSSRDPSCLFASS